MITKKDRMNRSDFLVPRGGLEPPHLLAHEPESCVSTNSTTWAGVCEKEGKEMEIGESSKLNSV